MTGSAAPEAEDIRPFAVPMFRAVIIANTVSNTGAMIQLVGAGWLMTGLSNSTSDVALVQAAATLPMMLLALPAGALADSLDRRKLIIAAQSFMLLTSVLLAVAALSGIVSPLLLLLFTFVIGCGAAFNSPAIQASYMDLVPRRALSGAIAASSVGFNLARTGGPALGGAIVAGAGAAAAFLVNAASSVGLIIVMAFWRSPAKAEPHPEPMFSAMASGLRYASLSPNLRNSLLRSTLFGLTAVALPALMPLVAKHLLAGGPLIYGGLLVAFGIGAISGAAMSARVRARFVPERIIQASTLCVAASLAAIALSSSLPVTAMAAALGGTGWVLGMSTFNTSIQMSAPRWVTARTVALFQMATFGGMAAGSFLFGLVADDVGLRWSLGLAGAMHLSALTLGVWMRLTPLDQMRADPLDRWVAPETPSPVDPDDGPVLVLIEYEIAEADEPLFLGRMRERRRIRRRDGAGRWSLHRDVGRPGIWVERYEVRTWIDYLRHNKRRTQSDAENGDAILALHRGAGPPHVIRLVAASDALSGLKAISEGPYPSP